MTGAAQALRASLPPSTGRIAPVMYDASLEHSHTATAATSSGRPTRCIGTPRPTCCGFMRGSEDRARRHRVDADALVGVVIGCGLGQADHPVLGIDVGGEA